MPNGKARSINWKPLLARSNAGSVRRGLAIPDTELPRYARAARHRSDPAFEGRMERLKAMRVTLVSRLDLQPGVLCPNGTLEAIARAEPRSLDALLWKM